MVRGSSSSKKSTDDKKNMERTRLKNLSIKKKMVSETQAKGFRPLRPTKQVVKHHGKDILRKSSQRKNRFLFSFPGLLAPLTGGKMGDLKNLGTQNPVLYLDFPQIVFSDVWWIGRKEENPDEARLDFPKELSEGQDVEYDFKGGAGAAAVDKGVPAAGKKDLEEGSPEALSEDEFSDIEKTLKDRMEVTPVRQSERTAGKRFKFVEVSSEDEPAGSDADLPEAEEKKVGTKVDNSTSSHTTGNASNHQIVDPGINSGDVAEKNYSSKQILSSTQSVTNSRKLSEFDVTVTKSKEDLCTHGSLVQATISTLFKKVEAKNAPSSLKKSSASKASGQNLQHQAEVSKKKDKLIKAKSSGMKSTAKKKAYEDSDGSDQDWAA